MISPTDIAPRSVQEGVCMQWYDTISFFFFFEKVFIERKMAREGIGRWIEDFGDVISIWGFDQVDGFIFPEGCEMSSQKKC